MFENDHYRWDRDPEDGEYEFQFDRFETASEAHDQAVFIIVDTEIDEDVGDAILPTVQVPDLQSDEEAGGIYIGTVKDGEIVDMWYDPERTEQQREKIGRLYDQVQATSDSDSLSDDGSTDAT